MSRPYQPGSPLGPEQTAVRQQDYRLLPPAERRPAIFAKKGIITFAVGPGEKIQVLDKVEGEERIAVSSGGLVMVYNDRASGTTLQVTAQRAVVFLEPGSITDLAMEGQAAAEKIHGVYLEGDVVASDGRYTLRGPKVYYDVRNNKAVMLDAVFHTFDELRGLPLYLRAQAIRQEAKNQFSAQHATLATSSFFEPHMSLGATSITVTQTKAPARPTLEEIFGWGEETDGKPRERDAMIVDASGVTLRAGAFPFFWWPGMKGDPSAFPLRAISVTGSSNSGTAIKTTWDVFSLLGVDAPEELSWVLRADGYFERGPGIGSTLNWRTEDSSGGITGYTLINDDGTDTLSSGAEIKHDGETRGTVVGEHVWNIDSSWRLFIEGAYFSDVTYVDAFQRAQAQSAREFKNNIYLQGIDSNAVLSLEAGIEANDFTPNQYLQQSLGYNTIKQPEFRYARINDDLLAGSSPGC